MTQALTPKYRTLSFPPPRAIRLYQYLAFAPTSTGPPVTRNILGAVLGGGQQRRRSCACQWHGGDEGAALSSTTTLTPEAACAAQLAGVPSAEQHLRDGHPRRVFERYGRVVYAPCRTRPASLWNGVYCLISPCARAASLGVFRLWPSVCRPLCMARPAEGQEIFKQVFIPEGPTPTQSN